MALTKSVIKWILPSDWWDTLRKLRRRSPYLVATEVMRNLNHMKQQGFLPDVILDVGAAHGEWTKSCLSIFPDAQYVLVEPLPDYDAELRVVAKSGQVQFIKAAVGRQEGELPLLVPDDPGGSSFLPAADANDPYFKGSVAVPVVPLDSLKIPGGRFLLKLDVQGYELEALAGAEKLLDRVEVIISECSLHPFQRGIPLIHDLVQRAVELGFRLYDVGDQVRWESGTLAQVDLLFVDERSSLLDRRWWR